MLVLAVVAVAVVLAAAAGRLGSATLRQHRVQAVADVTALAAVVGGPQGAARVATRNDADLLGVVVGVDGALGVTVARDGSRAAAAAAPG